MRTQRSRTAIVATLAILAIPLVTALTTRPGFAALSEVQLAETRGLSPGYPVRKVNNVEQTVNCVSENKPPGKVATASCTGAASNLACGTCQVSASQPDVDTSGSPTLLTGYTTAPMNQSCGGYISYGVCASGSCTNTTISGDSCGNNVPAYIKQNGPPQ